MIKVLFICHGNICRSPMAEFILKDMIEKRGIKSQFYISSSATSTEEIWNGKGNPVYPPAKDELQRHGLSCKGKYAVKLKKSDYDLYDLFIGMDSQNIRNMNYIFGGDPENKIHKLMDYVKSGGEVDDPWYSGRFDITYNDIYNGCCGLIEYLLER